MHRPLISRWARVAIAVAFVGLGAACRNAPPREAPSAGSPSLDFVLKDLDGKDVRLSDFKGKPILINFWATWCPPCKAEIPWFVEFADKYKSQQLVVLGISVDDPVADIRAYATEHKINYAMLVGDGQNDLKASYDADTVIPVSWMIKADGTLLAKAQGIHSKEWFENNIQLLVGAD